MESNYKSMSPSEFFYKNRQMAGYSNPSRSLFTIVKELIDNSLDSCESIGRLPNILLTIDSKNTDFIVISVIDNGSGIPVENVPYVFGKVFYGSKFGYRQSRGALGMGVTMAILYSQISTNMPAEIETSVDGIFRYYYKIKIDIKNNEPIIEEMKKVKNTENWIGTSVRVYAKGDYVRARQKILEYLNLTALIAPYLSLKFIENDKLILKYERVTKLMPYCPPECKPHPHGIDFESFMRYAQEDNDATILKFFTSTFQRVGVSTAKKFLKFVNISPNIKVHDLSQNTLYSIFKELSKFDFPKPDAKCLSPLGKKLLAESIKNRYSSQQFVYEISQPSSHHGHPFIIECIAFISEKFSSNNEPKLIRFANRVPLIYSQSDDVFYNIIKGLKFNKRIFKEKYPIFLFHICSTHVPFRDIEKTAIATIPEIYDSGIKISSKCLSKLEKMIVGESTVQHSLKQQKILRQHLRKSLKYAYYILYDHEPTEHELNKLLTRLEADNH